MLERSASTSAAPTNAPAMVAAVMGHHHLPAHAGTQGTRIACPRFKPWRLQSPQGGTLLVTPLLAPTAFYAVRAGPSVAHSRLPGPKARKPPKNRGPRVPPTVDDLQPAPSSSGDRILRTQAVFFFVHRSAWPLPANADPVNHRQGNRPRITDYIGAPGEGGRSPNRSTPRRCQILAAARILQ